MGLFTTLASKLNDDLRLDVTYCDDLLLMNTKEVWTYVIVDGEALGIPTNEDIDAHQSRLHVALENFRERDFHYYSATRPFDTTAWMERVLENQRHESELTGVQPAPVFEQYVQGQALAMEANRYKTFTKYLGIKLGDRKKMADPEASEDGNGLVKALSRGKQYVQDQAASIDPQPSRREVMMWAKEAAAIRARLSRGVLRARGATQEDMWGLIWHMCSLGTNVDSTEGTTSEPWGSGRVYQLAPEMDTRNPQLLRFSRTNPHLVREYRDYQEQEARHAADPANVPLPIRPEPVLTGNAVVLSVQLPDEVGVPWVYDATTRNEPVDVSIRFRVKADTTARNEAQKAQERLRQAKQHQEESGIAGGTVETQDKYDKATAHATTLKKGLGVTQVDFKARFIVHGPDETGTMAAAKELIQDFEERRHITLHWLPGLQETLFKEALPGQLTRTRASVHQHKADIQALTNGLPFSCQRLGYMSGLYVGAFGQQPFLFDPARAAREGKAPAIVNNGSLGGGKTSAMLTYADMFMVRGYTLIGIDPKKDLRSLLALKGRGHMREWSLTRDGQPGVLDPFTLFAADVIPDDPERDTVAKAQAKWREETQDLVTDVIQNTLGAEAASTLRTQAILADVIGAEMASTQPSMAGLLERFKNGETTTGAGDSDPSIAAELQQKSREIYSLLSKQANSSRGRLIYGERKSQESIMLKNVHTTIVDVSGLTLPQPGEAVTTDSQRISVTLFSLVTAYAMRILENPEIKGPKGLLIDEYHLIKDLPAMSNMATRSNRMGRSLNIIPMYADQSAESSKDTPAFRNAVGARCVFRSSRSEALAVAESLDRPGDGDLVDSIPAKDDPAGVALHTTPADSELPDSGPGIGVVKFDRDWNAEYTDAFETNDIPGFTRAAYRHYPLDQFGVLHDPLSPKLNRIEYDAGAPENTPPGDATEHDQEPGESTTPATVGATAATALDTDMDGWW